MPRREQTVRLVLTGAMVIAPFLALLRGPIVGVVVMLAGVLGAIWIGWDAVRTGAVDNPERTRIVLAVNSVVAVLLLIAVIWLLRG